MKYLNRTNSLFDVTTHNSFHSTTGTPTRILMAGRSNSDDNIGMTKSRTQLNNCGTNELTKPDDELDLPDIYKMDDFWTVLAADEEVQSGKWVKGLEGQLTFKGLLGLADGQWLASDFIDCYLAFIVKNSFRVRFIPTFAILSFDNTGDLPSKWYWPLTSADFVLAPAHLYGKHWAMVVVNLLERNITIMDSYSMHDKGRAGQTKMKFMQKIWDLLHYVADQQQEQEYFGWWNDWAEKFTEDRFVPQQECSEDSGIFALLFARFVAKRSPIDFGPEHIQYFRRRFCWDLLHTIHDEAGSRSSSSSDDIVKVTKSRTKLKDCGTNELTKPDDELDLPDIYKTDDFWKSLKTNEVVQSEKWVKGLEEQLTFKGLLGLADGQWLASDFIDCYLAFIVKNSHLVRYIPTFAILSYNNTKKIPAEWYWPLTSAEIVLAPTHLNNSHWAMTVIDIPKRKIRVMDSLNKGRAGQTKMKFMESVWDILHYVAEQQHEEEYFGGWSEWDCKEVLDIPQQKNGTDCGIFALLFARCAAERRPIDFDQRHIPYFRRRFCWDIVHTIKKEG